MKIFHLFKNLFSNMTSKRGRQLTLQRLSGQITRKENLTKPLVVVDVGCRWGFAERFLSSEHLYDFKIIGFEPDREECDRLLASYQYLPSGTVTCVPLGLAGAKGQRSLHITKEPACSSLYAPIQFLADNYPALDCIKPKQTVAVKVTTIKQWAREHGLNYIDYLKIDTQGSELEILKGAEDLLDSIRCIDIEVEFNPIYEGQALFGETDIYLRSKGFVLWRLSNLVHYSLTGDPTPLEWSYTMCFDTKHRLEIPAYSGQLFWADATYINTDVLKSGIAKSEQIQRDTVLFATLGMNDVVDHIKRVIRSA